MPAGRAAGAMDAVLWTGNDFDLEVVRLIAGRLSRDVRRQPGAQPPEAGAST